MVVASPVHRSASRRIRRVGVDLRFLGRATPTTTRRDLTTLAARAREVGRVRSRADPRRSELLEPSLPRGLQSVTSRHAFSGATSGCDDLKSGVAARGDPFLLGGQRSRPSCWRGSPVGRRSLAAIGPRRRAPRARRRRQDHGDGARHRDPARRHDHPGAPRSLVGPLVRETQLVVPASTRAIARRGALA